MRNAFAEQLTKLATNDDRIVLLSGDIGNQLFNDFKAIAPDRFINAGIAEANMIGVAAGLAIRGFRPIAYTIAPFITARCLEQIRIDLCYHKLPVVIVGVGAGLSYAQLGATHQAMEDIAQMRTLPGMTVVCPGDAHEVRGALAAARECDGPVYLRLGKKGEPIVHDGPPVFEIGSPIVVRAGEAGGRDVAILSVGTMLPAAMELSDRLLGDGVSATVMSWHTVKPLNEKVLGEIFADYAVVATVEEHSRLGGFGSAVAEWWCDQQTQPRGRLIRFANEDRFMCEAGKREDYHKRDGLTPGAMAARIGSVLEEVRAKLNVKVVT